MAHFVRGNTKEISDSLSKPATYKVLYWPIAANGATTRDLLELGGVQWEDLSPSFTVSVERGLHSFLPRIDLGSMQVHSFLIFNETTLTLGLARREA